MFRWSTVSNSLSPALHDNSLGMGDVERCRWRPSSVWCASNIHIFIDKPDRMCWSWAKGWRLVYADSVRQFIDDFLNWFHWMTPKCSVCKIRAGAPTQCSIDLLLATIPASVGCKNTDMWPRTVVSAQLLLGRVHHCVVYSCEQWRHAWPRGLWE